MDNIMSGKDWKQIWTCPKPITDPKGFYNGFNPSTTILKKGYKHEKGDVTLSCDVIWERDTAVKMRDGVSLYTDIFRPIGSGKFPAVISWSPYGKSNIDNDWVYNEHDLSHLQKEEGVDPALWCAHGYAVAHPDARGAYMSEGNIFHWGTNEGKDIYDYIEWLASQEWCNGCVGMAGNSYLTIVQWFAADQQPPHLKAIAPWEGQTDAYRETILQGGISDVAFPRQAVNCMHGNNYVDDMPSMAEHYPLMNTYWDNKRAVLKDINIPCYIVASYTNPIHTFGTFRAYREIPSKDKWLRIHNSTEWVDFYRPENQAELIKFFDHYLKGIDNDWEETPRVRYSVLNPGGKDETGIVSNAFPPEGVEYKKLYLENDGKLVLSAQSSTDSTDVTSGNVSEDAPGHLDYDGSSSDACAEFYFRFDKDTDIVGYPNVKLYVEGVHCSDMDLFIEIGKVNENGKWITWNCTPHNRYLGPIASYDGRLRVSVRALDPEKSSEHIPIQSFESLDPLNADEIVEANIAIRPVGLRFKRGELLKLRIGNENTGILEQGRRIGTMNNTGIHRIWFGKGHGSYLEVPVVKK